ncbi:MAG TPA: hypothetical protein VNE17_10765, partial [Nitrolancea sp.]|nr:hypothetical protein [Nitrolancea sp.]
GTQPGLVDLGGVPRFFISVGLWANLATEHASPSLISCVRRSSQVDVHDHTVICNGLAGRGIKRLVRFRMRAQFGGTRLMLGPV